MNRLPVLLVLTVVNFCCQAVKQNPSSASKAPICVVGYRLAPTATVSGVYSLQAGITSIAVQRFKDIHYAHFSFVGRTELRISVSEAISKWSLSPRHLEIPAKTEGRDLLLAISEPSKLVVRINDRERLFIFADSLDKYSPRLCDAGVVNIVDSGVDNSSGEVQTARIQAAIDSAAKDAVLFFPPGLYRTGTLELKSNITLYLAGGCLIQGTDSLKDYKGNVNDGKNSTGRLILVDRSENVAIKGLGTIDANGTILRNQNDHRGRVLLIRNSRNVFIEGVILRDPPSWNTHILGCENVTIRNVKLLNDPGLGNTDGFDPDACRHVLIENCFAYCSDDAVAIKCAGYDGIYRDVEDIVVRGNVLLTKKSALKVGTESRTTVMKNILFEANDVIFADRGMTLYCHDGATYSDIRFIDNRFEECYPDIKQCLMDFYIKDRKDYDKYYGGVGQIRNVLVRGCEAYTQWPRESTFRGSLDSKHLISEIRFEDFVIAGKACRNLQDARISIRADVKEYVTNVTFSVSDGRRLEKN